MEYVSMDLIIASSKALMIPTYIRPLNTQGFVTSNNNVAGSFKYSKTCLKGHYQKDQRMVFNTSYRLMQVKSIAECSKGSILQYFRPSLSYHLSLRSLFCLLLSGR